MTSKEIRNKFLEFFEKRGHKIVPSSSLLPKDDPSVLLTTAGMQQFKPYYTDQKDPIKDFGSRRTVSIQKSFKFPKTKNRWKFGNLWVCWMIK
ncbi:MAG: alanine--tRNA ligase-related protein [Candidatus Azambacteria bacterium]|nr:alanine--tRNA ligase-related protein [Candidatus Azambacteria bacterium]